MSGGRSPTVGVIILGFEGPAKDALNYLVTHLNVVQKEIEFQLVPLCPGTGLQQLLGRTDADHEEAFGEIAGFRDSQRLFLKQLDVAYGLSGDLPDKFVVVSLAAWVDNFYSVEDHDVAVIALGHWQRQMAPPSAVEIALSIILVSALRIALPSAPTAHIGTKGCLFDFNASVPDVRHKVLNAHICQECCQSFAASGHKDIASKLSIALDSKWRGALSDGTSPASICRKLGYDLFRTKGLTPTFWETLLDTLRTDSAKTIVQILTTLAIGLLGVGVLTKN